MITLLIFILVLGALVFAHEMGHFFVAQKMGIRCDEFGLGFPPRIFGWKKINGKRKFFWGSKKVESEDTIYSLNWIPLGGFVSIKGEDGHVENGQQPDKDSFASKKAWKRISVLTAGVAMNFVFAAIILMIIFTVGSPQMIDSEAKHIRSITDEKIQVINVLKDTPAEEAGLEVGDVILSLDDQQIEKADEIGAYLEDKAGKQVTVKIQRFDKKVDIVLKAEEVEEIGAVALGVGLTDTGIVAYKFPYSLWLGLKSTVMITGAIAQGLYLVIKNLIISQPTGIDVAGPVGIAVMTGKFARLGIVYLLQFTALLSINLAIINFLPLPALDGGRILFILIEKIRRKKVSQKLENMVHTIGFALLMVLIIFITGYDISRFKEVFKEFFGNLF